MPTITLRRVTKRYPGATTAAVDELDLTVEHGDFMCLLGPSGCGKTTTLRMIAGLEPPTAGSISVEDRVLDSVDDGVCIPPERRDMGMVFQSYALWPHMTIRQNTDYGLRLRKIARAERNRRADEVMAVMGIDRYADRYPSQLSGGQQQRAALARMLAVNPGVMLLDEPLSNLDARLRLEMRAELKRIHRDFGSTIVFVTHDQWEAMTLATRIAVMFDGRLQQIGSPTDIYDRPRNRLVAEFLGNPPLNVVEFVDSESAPHVSAAYAFGTARMQGSAAAAGSVGFRPESIRIERRSASTGDGLSIEGTVFAVLATGGSWTVEVVADGHHFFATTSVPPVCRPGDDIRMRIAPDDVHVFDTAGDRVDANSLSSPSNH
ncbi:ABC transporter ATP-binding protein [Mycobacterium sp. 852013-51886_SCH5428379]|uniref:ABC transporter ATP-binding protein n=1 Tax=Mycobacterium sp. 852013-51886_SCH5428379 TaxID=1834111 RepID=UPI0007FE2347|nr:ABC transporter ATP-binding protein [Mycobacterium sp. 852013-51886_SCH5428379]OBB55642.1 ABC transporter ATP-binding protein [Mycobacterium sp. 852013-51886_SCH5428379]